MVPCPLNRFRRNGSLHLASEAEDTSFLEALRQESSDMFGKHGAAIHEHHQILQLAQGKVSTLEAGLTTLQQAQEEFPDMVKQIRDQRTLEVRQQYEMDQRKRDEILEREWIKFKEEVTATVLDSLSKTNEKRAHVENYSRMWKSKDDDWKEERKKGREHARGAEQAMGMAPAFVRGLGHFF